MTGSMPITERLWLMKEKFVIVSANKDWCGEWTRDEVEADMADIGCHGNWLEWIFDHVFDDYPTEILHALQHSSVSEVVAYIDGFRTEFTISMRIRRKPGA